MIYSVGGCRLLTDARRNELALDMIYSKLDNELALDMIYSVGGEGSPDNELGYINYELSSVPQRCSMETENDLARDIIRDISYFSSGYTAAISFLY